MEAYDITPTRRCGLCHVATDSRNRPSGRNRRSLMTSRMKCKLRATRLRKPSRIAPLPASLGNRSISHPPALVKSVVTSSVQLANASNRTCQQWLGDVAASVRK